MTPLALAATCLFFKNSFNHGPKYRMEKEGGYLLIHDNYDDWLAMLLQVLGPAGTDVLILTQAKKTKSNVATVYWPSFGEQTWPVIKDVFGLVVLDEKEFKGRIIPTWILHYTFNILVFGGRMIIVDGKKILTIMEKGDLANAPVPKELIESA